MVTLLLSALGIFALRIVDVSIGTLRIAMLVRGRRLLAGLFGFVESLVWLIAAALVFGNLDSPVQFIAYAGGYAAGTILGGTLERWLAIGDALLRIVTTIGTPELAPILRQQGYYVTTVNAEGRDGEVRVSFSVVPRKQVAGLLKLIHTVNPAAFVTFEETTPVRLAVTPAVRVRK